MCNKVVLKILMCSTLCMSHVLWLDPMASATTGLCRISMDNIGHVSFSSFRYTVVDTFALITSLKSYMHTTFVCHSH